MTIIMRLEKMNWLLNVRHEYMPRNSLLILYVAALLIAVLWIRNFFNRTKRFPVVGKPSDSDFRLAIIEGIASYPNTPFFVPETPPLLILPKSTIQDIKSYNDEEVSFNAFIEAEFHPNLTGFGNADPLLLSVVKNDISRQIASSLVFLQDEAAYSLKQQLGPCEDWNSFDLYQKVAEIVALVNSRVFVGRPLSRDKDWVATTINYTLEVVKTKNAISKWPSWTLSIIGPHLKEVKSIYKFIEHAADLLKPILSAQLAKEGNEKLYSDDGDEIGNGIAWFLARMGTDERKDPKKFVNRLLTLSFTAIHTTSNSLVQAILDLATHRQYIPILIDEINKVILEDGYDISDDGVLRMRKSSMPKLARLDSFLKESQRLNPPSLVSHARKVISDVTLSSGHTIRKGTNIAIPSWYIHNNSDALLSPGITKPLDEFDGLRFHSLRQLPGNENRHLFVSTSPESLAFGHGNHACPGRFFAENSIKVIMIELLTNWDFRLPGDDKLEGGTWRRPRNKYHKLGCSSDPLARVEFRRKKR